MKSTRTFVRLCLVLLFLGTGAVGTFADDLSGPSETTGSVLVFPYFTSNLANDWDTRMTIANTDFYRRDGAATPILTTVYAHVFIIDGQTCSQADQYVCLTPHATISFLASDIDPEVTGYLIVVAVDGNTGNPINQNSLIGDAFVSEGRYVGNYGAPAFRAYGNPGINLDGSLNFGDLTNGYDFAPTRYAFSIQSPVDAPGQRIVTASISGDLTNGILGGAGQTMAGSVYNGNERPFGSFVGFHQGGCQAISVIALGFPRVPTGITKVIPAGQVGTMAFPTLPTVGLFMTPTGNNKWSGIRGLHKTRYSNATLVVPIFSPAC
jgi:hypothetical protein